MWSFGRNSPQAALHICLFHTMRSFCREVTTEMLAILPGERDHVLELITKLIYAKSESEYDSLYQDLLQTRLSTVVDYYNSNRHSIQHEWVECFKGVNFTLGETTNKVCIFAPGTYIHVNNCTLYYTILGSMCSNSIKLALPRICIYRYSSLSRFLTSSLLCCLL